MSHVDSAHLTSRQCDPFAFFVGLDKTKIEFQKLNDDQVKKLLGNSRFLKKKSDAVQDQTGDQETDKLAEKAAELKINDAAKDNQETSKDSSTKENKTLKLSFGSNDFRFDFAIPE